MSDKPKIITLKDGEYIMSCSVDGLSEEDKKERRSFPVYLTMTKSEKPKTLDLIVCPTGEKQ